MKVLRLRKVIEKSWNFASGPYTLLLFLIVSLVILHFFHYLPSSCLSFRVYVCFSPCSQTLNPHLITPDATYHIATTISPCCPHSLDLRFGRICLHGNCNQAHSCLDAGFVHWGEVLMPGRICLLTPTEMQLTPQ